MTYDNIRKITTSQEKKVLDFSQGTVKVYFFI